MIFYYKIFDSYLKISKVKYKQCRVEGKQR